MHYRMNNSNDYGHLRVRSNIVRLRGSQILSRVYLKHACAFWQNFPSLNHTNSLCWNLVPLNQAQLQFQGFQWIIVQTLISFQLQLFEEIEIHHKLIIENTQPGCSFSIGLLNWKRKWMSNENESTIVHLLYACSLCVLKYNFFCKYWMKYMEDICLRSIPIDPDDMC